MVTLTGAQEEACAADDAPRWRVLLDRANAGPRCGATCKRTGQHCRGAAMPNGRCRMHGGASTGATTAEGKARCRAASWKQGGRDAAARGRARERAEARRIRKLLQTLIEEAARGTGR